MLKTYASALMVDMLTVMRKVRQQPQHGSMMGMEETCRLTTLTLMQSTREKEKKKERHERAREAQCFATIAVEKGTCPENAQTH